MSSEEYFYGATLSGENASVVWENEKDEVRTNKLVIKQVLLGVDAKEGEYNVIQADTTSNRERIKIPIAILNAGEGRQSRLDLEFTDSPVTFTLISGKGPVYIHGLHISVQVFDVEEMQEEIEEEEEDEEEDEGIPKKKPKLSNNSNTKKKLPGGGGLKK